MFMKSKCVTKIMKAGDLTLSVQLLYISFKIMST